MRERKTIDHNALRASSFLERASETKDDERRLLCLYDSFVCLFGPFSACDQAASAAGLAVSEFKALLSSCIGDSDVDLKTARAVSPSGLSGICMSLQTRMEELLSSHHSN